MHVALEALRPVESQLMINNDRVEMLLQDLVGKVYAELLETILLKHLKAKDV